MITKIDDFVFNELTESELEKYKKVIDERLDYVKNNPIMPKEKYWLHVDFYYGDGDRTVDYVQEIDYETFQALEQCDKTKEYEFYNEFLGCPEGTINHFCRWFKTTGSKDYSRNLEDGDWNMDNILEELVTDFNLERANENFKKESLDKLLANVDISQELLKLDDVLDSDITENILTEYLTYFDKNLFKNLLKLHVLKNDPFDFSLKNIFGAIDFAKFESINFDWGYVKIEVRNEDGELEDFYLLEYNFEIIDEISSDYFISKGLMENSDSDWTDTIDDVYTLLIDINNVREFMLMVKSYYI
jgi:hypothetical protein